MCEYFPDIEAGKKCSIRLSMGFYGTKLMDS
jgi:hypothetical protein